MRKDPTHGIMDATREEESWQTGIAGTAAMNWPRTIASVPIAELPYKKPLTFPPRRQMYQFRRHPSSRAGILLPLLRSKQGLRPLDAVRSRAACS
jgi:hypothetical protein